METYNEQARKSSEDAEADAEAGLKKFGPGKLWIEKVWAQNILLIFTVILRTLTLRGQKNLRLRPDVLSLLLRFQRRSLYNNYLIQIIN